MMINSAAKQRADKLGKMARAAIVDYNKEVAGGGEPLFPDWTLELIGLIADYDRMLGTLAKQHLQLVTAWDFETGLRSASVVRMNRAAS